MTRQYFWLLLFLMAAVVVSLMIPSLDIHSDTGSFIFWNLRLPRVMLGLLIGAGLTLSGVVFQTVFRNPLAEPYLLGISAGAAAGAALAIGLGLTFTWGIFSATSLAAFISGSGAVILVYFLAWAQGPVKSEKLLLLGIGISSLFTAGLAVSVILSDQLRAIYFWLLGSLANSSWEQVVSFFICGLATFFCLLFFSRKMDLLTLNDAEAASLGVNVPVTQIVLIFLATILTALAVSYAGIIGFVGLLGPHIARMIFGETHRRLLPAAAALGALFLVTADTISRVLLFPGELPLGIITAIIGAPYFIWLLARKKN